MAFEEIVFPQCRLITSGNSQDDDRGTGILGIRETYVHDDVYFNIYISRLMDRLSLG